MTASSGPIVDEDCSSVSKAGEGCDPAGRPHIESAQEEPSTRPAPKPLLLPGLVGRRLAPAISLPVERRQGEASPQPSPTESSGTPVQWVTDTVTTPAHVTRQKAKDIITPAPLKALSASTRLHGGSEKSDTPKSPAVPPLTRHISWAWDPKEALVWAWHGKLTKIYHNYTVENLLGQGRYGAVFAVQHKVSGHDFACKILQKTDQNPEMMRSEIAAMKRLDHPNIVRIYETIEDKTQVFLLMELCNGGDLLKRIRIHGHLTEQTSRCFAKQLLSALAYCHDRSVVHRDVKPENILLQTGDNGCSILKLADFGVARSLRKQRSTSCTVGGFPSNDDMMGSSSLVDAGFERAFAGSLPYMSPEVLRQELISPASACDVWSCGVVIYGMLSGALPFGDRPDLICSGVLPECAGGLWDSVSEDATSLIRQLLQPRVGKRWTANQALASDWFKPSCNRALGIAQSLSSARPCVTGVSVDGALSKVATSPHNTNASPAEEGSHEIACASSCIQGNLAETLCLHLSRWKQMPKLRRIALAAIAKRLDASHPAQRLAVVMYESFKATSDANLQCKELVRRLLESSSYPDALSSRGRSEHIADFVDLSDMVDALDAMKNGAVDYTLLVAALLRPESFNDHVCVAQAFRVFDPRGQGKISPTDLQMTIKGRHVSSNDFKAMVAEYDLNGDGMLDLAEFESMVRGTQTDDINAPVPSHGGA